MEYRNEYTCLAHGFGDDVVSRKQSNDKYMIDNGLTDDNSVEYDWGLDKNRVVATTKWKTVVQFMKGKYGAAIHKFTEEEIGKVNYVGHITEKENSIGKRLKEFRQKRAI